MQFFSFIMFTELLYISINKRKEEYEFWEFSIFKFQKVFGEVD